MLELVVMIRYMQKVTGKVKFERLGRDKKESQCLSSGRR